MGLHIPYVCCDGACQKQKLNHANSLSASSTICYRTNISSSSSITTFSFQRATVYTKCNGTSGHQKYSIPRQNYRHMMRGMIIASLFAISSADEFLVDEYEAEEAADFEQRKDIANHWQPIICMINILIALAICYCWMNSIADNMERGKDTKYDKESQSTMDCSSSCETCHARIRNSRSIPNTINISRHHVSKADVVPIIPQYMDKDEEDTELAEELYQTRKFARSTWNMYYRITSARQARAKCQICFGSMEENEEEAIVQACPSDLHREEGERESSLLLSNTHQECYYGAISSEQTCRVCPRAKLLKSDDNMIFDLDL